MKCTHCQGELAPGKLSEQFRVQFVPDGAPFFTLTTNLVAVEALMCLNCGRIELRGDVEKLREVLGR